MKVKRCSRCRGTKPVSEFSPRKDARDGLQYWCKVCMAAAVARSTARKRARSKL